MFAFVPFEGVADSQVPHMFAIEGGVMVEEVEKPVDGQVFEAFVFFQVSQEKRLPQ